MAKFGKGNPGRPKGAQNKLSRTAKEAIQYAFDAIGGAEALAKWAKSHPGDFYRGIYPRILPHEVTGSDGEALALVGKIVHVHEPAAKPEGV